MKTKFFFRGGIMVFLPIVLLLGITVFFITEQTNTNHLLQSESQTRAKIYVCSMHPEVIQDKPGDCPICGMSLIEKAEQNERSVDMSLKDVVLPVNESVLASVQTTSPVCCELPLIVEASGIINYDAGKVRMISAKFRGLIEKSYIKYKFQPIHKGQKIYDIYCPEIYLEHIDYLNLIKTFPDKPDLIHDAHEWLLNIGLTNEQIESLIKDKVPNYHLSVYSEADGYVVGSDFNPESDFTFEGKGNSSGGNFGIGLTEGVLVEAGTPLFKVVNVESVRADLKIRTEDAGLLKTGQNVILTDAVSPNRKLNAKISQIEPLNGGLFQVVRIYISDKKRQLYPGMKIQAYIEAGKHNSTWVSKSAVAHLGQHNAVFIRQDSVFVAKIVRIGLRSGNKIEICSDIDQNSVLAANASLLTDSDGFIKTK